ncbi:MAG: hypothetical protein HPY57_14770 [Ignavibacteria bacterium]|nr:hypothetical protein [Ignavibacteria bacterium]
MYSYFKYLILLESKRIDDLRNKYVDKLGLNPEIFDYFTNYKDILETILKIYINTPKDIIKNIETKGTKYHELLVKMLKKYVNNRENIKSVEKITDIKDLEHLRFVLNDIVDYDDTSGFDNSDLWILENSYEYFIYKPYTFDASEQYGNRKERDNNWCTAYNEDHFKEHLGPDGGLLYIINKFNPEKDWAIEFDGKKLNAWNYKDENIFTANSLKSLIENIWEPTEEPYIVLMDNLEKLERDIPSIDWERARNNAIYEISNMDIYDIISNWGSYELFYYVDDKKFFEDIKESEYDRYYDDWKYESNLNDIVIKILRNDFDEWSEKNKKHLFDYFIPKMKKANEKNEYEYYDVIHTDIEDIISFIENTYDNKEMVYVIEDIGLEDEVIQYLVDEYVDNFKDVEDYIRYMYGNIDNLNRKELNILSNYIDWNGLARDIVENMDEDELKYYI